MSILSSMRYLSRSPDEYTNLWLALGFMPFGLFFDFFDGKVARWRHKSSLMGQELDSLADLVCKHANACQPVADDRLGFLWHLPCSGGLCDGSPNACRSAHTIILRAMWLNALGQIQRHRRSASQRQDWKITILRRHTHTICLFDKCSGASIVGFARLGS